MIKLAIARTGFARHGTLWLCLTVNALLLAACSSDQPAAGFGLELSKPSGWTFVSAGTTGIHDDTLRYDAAALATAIAQRTTTPLFALLKRAPPQSALNPTFGINLERGAENRGQTALALLGTRVARASDHGPFVVAQATSATKLAGLDAAHAELRTPAGQGVATRVRLDLVVIGDVSVLLAATDAVSGVDDASAEFQTIITSLKFPGASTAR